MRPPRQPPAAPPRGNYAPPPGGDSGRGPFSVGFFITGTTSFASAAAAYLGYEVWVYADGRTTKVENGHVLTATNPGVPLDPTQTYLPGDIVVGRLGPGAGGRVWELFGPTSSGGSGSGRSAGSSGGGVRCTGTVYSTVRYRYVRAGDQLVEVSQLETLAWDATGCLVATVGDTSSTVIGCAPCPSDEGSKTPVDVFALCDDAPATLNYEITSDDIPCLDGDAGTIAKSGSTWGPSSTNPCGSDNTLAVTCTGDVWTAVYSTTDTVVTLEDQGPDYLLFKLVSDGHGTVPAGSAYITVTVP